MSQCNEVLLTQTQCHGGKQNTGVSISFQLMILLSFIHRVISHLGCQHLKDKFCPFCSLRNPQGLEQCLIHGQTLHKQLLNDLSCHNSYQVEPYELATSEDQKWLNINSCHIIQPNSIEIWVFMFNSPLNLQSVFLFDGLECSLRICMTVSAE